MLRFSLDSRSFEILVKGADGAERECYRRRCLNCALLRNSIRARMPSSKPSATDSAGKPGIPIGKETICVEVDVVDPVVVIVDVVS